MLDLDLYFKKSVSLCLGLQINWTGCLGIESTVG